MSTSKLPARASLEYPKKLAKDRLQELRRSDPTAKLATALLSVAREHGFSSWRALKAEMEQRQATHVAEFFEVCGNGDEVVNPTKPTTSAMQFIRIALWIVLLVSAMLLPFVPGPYDPLATSLSVSATG
jgi:hypothetical protein